MWFPASWAPIVAEWLFERSVQPNDPSNNIEHGQPARGLSQNISRGHEWHQPTHELAGPSGDATVSESNEVMYKIRRWSLPGDAVMPVLNVSSRVTWLELDDKALLDSYDVLQEGILCDVFSQKCSAAWQGAPGQRLTVSIMLPGRQLADEWLDFMLSQRNLWPTFTTKGASTEKISERIFRKERRRLRAKPRWMRIKIIWDSLHNRMYTAAPTGKSREQLYELLFNRATKSSLRNPYEEKEYHGPDHREVRPRWEQSQQWMWYYMRQSEPQVLDINSVIRAFRDKEEDARAEIDKYMDYCAKRWQTREGRYQLKRQRLLPDVRDPPAQREGDVDMMDI